MENEKKQQQAYDTLRISLEKNIIKKKKKLKIK